MVKLSEERSKEAKESLSTSRASSDNKSIIQYRSELLEIALGDGHDRDSITNSTSDSDSTTYNEQNPQSDNVDPEKSLNILKQSPKETLDNAFFTKNENTVKRNNSCCEGTKNAFQR